MKNKFKNEPVMDFIKRKRIEQGLSQRKLSDMLEIDHRELSRYEQGKTMIPAWILYKVIQMYGF